MPSYMCAIKNLSLLSSMLRWIMLAKSWNYAFMDSRIMLAKSSYYALARGDTHSLCCTYGASKENCAFFVHVLANGHKYNKIHEYTHTKVSMHARDQQRKEKTLHLLHVFTTTFCKKIFHC